MQEMLNYLFCRQPRDTSVTKDRDVKIVATGIGLALGTGLIASAVNNVRSSITKENALYCANQSLATLIEFQRQIQIFNASCIPEEPGSNNSTCNTALLPKPVNMSCPDITVASSVNYLPMAFAIAGIVTFGLFMGRTILASYDQLKEQNAESWYIFRKSPTTSLLTGSETETLTEFSEGMLDSERNIPEPGV
jgi:hypothetical protein